MEMETAMPNPYYQDSSVTIYHGDCADILPAIIADLVITDPPWGVNLIAKQHKWFVQSGTGYSPNFIDDGDFIRTVVVPVVDVCRTMFDRVVVCSGTTNCFSYPQPDDIGCVYNSSGTGSGKWGFKCCTPILFYGPDPFLADGMGRRPNSWQQPANDYSEDNGHPCPKPLGLMNWLVTRTSRKGETILDPFMGSGTTLRAAKDLGRKAIGIEIEERYCEIAAKRMAQEVLQFA